MISLAGSDVFDYGYKQCRAVAPQELSLTPLSYPIVSSLPLLKCSTF